MATTFTWNQMWSGYNPPNLNTPSTKGGPLFRCLAACKRTELPMDDVSVLDAYGGTALCNECREERALRIGDGAVVLVEGAYAGVLHEAGLIG